jgi:hypothetical protein
MYQLSITQLAFPTEDDFTNSVKILTQNNIINIELILHKIINWDTPDINYLKKYVNRLNKLGFTCYSTQSITYNTSLQSFCDDNFIKHILYVSELCKMVGIKILVLGAPKLRDIYDENVLLNNFKKIDLHLKKNNQTLCIEPNSTWYGGRFFVNLDEIVTFIKKGNFTHIKTMIDTHNLTHENLNPSEEYLKYKDYIYHIHISETGLGAFIDSYIHDELSKILKQKDYQGIITYETQINKNIQEFKNKYI